MKKFQEFIWVLLGEPLSQLFMFFFGMLMLGWVFSAFGLMVFFTPTPLWLKWTVGVFNAFCLIMIIYGWIYGKWEEVYKQK